MRAQQLPDDSVVVEPGLFADGVGVRAIGATRLTIADNPSSERRIDRVVLDRSLGEAIVLTGAGSIPALTSGQIALARIVVEPGPSLPVLDAAIVDERALWAGLQNPVVAPPAALATFIRRRANDFDENDFDENGENDKNNVHGLHKVLFDAANAPGSITCGDGFDEDGSTFAVKAAGYYQVTCSLGVSGSNASKVRIHTQLGTESEARTFSNAFTTISGSNPVAIVSDILDLQAGERILIYGLKSAMVVQQASSGADISFLMVQLIALR